MTQMKKTDRQGCLHPLTEAELRLPDVGLVPPQYPENRLPYVGLVPLPKRSHQVGGDVAALLLQIRQRLHPRCLRVLTYGVLYSYPSSPPFVQHDTQSDLACLLHTPSTERQ